MENNKNICLAHIRHLENIYLSHRIFQNCQENLWETGIQQMWYKEKKEYYLAFVFVCLFVFTDFNQENQKQHNKAINQWFYKIYGEGHGVF